jgi:hypothetical protein
VASVVFMVTERGSRRVMLMAPAGRPKRKLRRFIPPVVFVPISNLAYLICFGGVRILINSTTAALSKPRLLTSAGRALFS